MDIPPIPASERAELERVVREQLAAFKLHRKQFLLARESLCEDRTSQAYVLAFKKLSALHEELLNAHEEVTREQECLRIETERARETGGETHNAQVPEVPLMPPSPTAWFEPAPAPKRSGCGCCLM